MAMMGKMGMDLQPGQMTPEEFAFSKKAIETYKNIREVIFQGDLFRLESPYSSNRASLMYVTKEKREQYSSDSFFIVKWGNSCRQ